MSDRYILNTKTGVKFIWRKELEDKPDFVECDKDGVIIGTHTVSDLGIKNLLQENSRLKMLVEHLEEDNRELRKTLNAVGLKGPESPGKTSAEESPKEPEKEESNGVTPVDEPPANPEMTLTDEPPADPDNSGQAVDVGFDYSDLSQVEVFEKLTSGNTKKQLIEIAEKLNLEADKRESNDAIADRIAAKLKG